MKLINLVGGPCGGAGITFHYDPGPVVDIPSKAGDRSYRYMRKGDRHSHNYVFIARVPVDDPTLTVKETRELLRLIKE